MGEKCISIIIPCYNVDNKIDRCLESIFANTIDRDKIVVICVDDASTDNTLAKLLEWEQKYPEHMIIIPCKENRRQGSARNIGLSYANSEYIAFIDADDWIEKEYLDRLLRIAMDGQYQIVQCDSVRDNSENLTYLKEELIPDDSAKIISIDTIESRKENIVYPTLRYLGWGKLIKRDFLIDNDIYFPEGLAYEDNYWGSLINIYADRFCIIKDKLYHYYVNDNSTVLKKNEYHHLDYITVQEIIWEEYINRGLLDIYPEEMVAEHIFTAFLQGLKICIYRFDEPNYHIYRLLRQMVLGHVGNIADNVYIKNGLGEKYDLMLTALNVELSKSEFDSFASAIKRIGM